MKPCHKVCSRPLVVPCRSGLGDTMAMAVATIFFASLQYPAAVRWMFVRVFLEWFDPILLWISVSVQICMMSMTLWFVMPILFSALMIVCRWQVCSVMACGGWVLVHVFYACESLSQQDLKTNRGIGGIKILALPFRRVSSEPRSLTCSRIVLSGVYIASPRRCQPSSPDSLTANDRVSSACRNQTLL